MNIGTSAAPTQITAKARGSAHRDESLSGSNALRIKGSKQGVKEERDRKEFEPRRSQNFAVEMISASGLRSRSIFPGEFITLNQHSGERPWYGLPLPWPGGA